MRIRIHSRLRLLKFCLVGLVAAAVLDDYAGWRLLLYGLGIAWLIGRLWVQALASGLRLEREIRFGWAQVGDQLEERFTLINTSMIPAAWVEIEDGSDLPGYSQTQVTGIDSGSRRTWHSSGICQRRGVYQLGPLTLCSSDPLGLYTLEIHDPRSVQLVVTPPVLTLPQIQVAMGGKAGEGRPRPDAPERTAAAASVRPYVAGDSLRMVHWPTTARRNELFVRTFDSTPAGDWMIVVDAFRPVQAGDADRSTLEHAVILAASLGERGLRLGRAVGLAALGAQTIWLAPQSGEAARWSMLQALARLEAGDQPLHLLLSRFASALGRTGSLILITPDVGGEWLASLLPLVWRGATPTILLLDPAAFSGSASTSSTGSAGSKFGLELARWGLTHQLIQPELLEMPQRLARSAKDSGIRITPSGRAVAVGPLRDSSWRSFTPGSKS